MIVNFHKVNLKKKLLEFSNLEKEDEFPDAVTQEELLDKKKRDRENLGSVNLRADEETKKFETEKLKIKNKFEFNLNQIDTSSLLYDNI